MLMMSINAMVSRAKLTPPMMTASTNFHILHLYATQIHSLTCLQACHVYKFGHACKCTTIGYGTYMVLFDITGFHLWQCLP